MSELTTDRQALVIGGSMAGLLAARVLADHFGQVTILERDRLPADPTFRAGVPQGRHVHVMLMQGQRILEQLFPGLVDELEAAGAPRVDWFKDCQTYTAFGRYPSVPSSFSAVMCSRELWEWGIRQRLAARANIRFLEGHDVVGLLPETGHWRFSERQDAIELLPDAGKTGVAGVRVRVRDAEAHTVGPEEELTADLVVDASGRDSRMPEWLEALGYPRPPEMVINSFPGYATRCYQRPADFQADWRLLVILYAPPQAMRGGVIVPIEGDRWLVTVAGVARDYPPTDEAGFLEFARSLATPVLYEAIKDATPLSPVYGYQRMENRLRQYERLARWPEGLIVFGDAVCAFNPYYGQGMTVAAQSALALDEHLREQRQRQPDGSLAGLGRRVQQAVAKIAATPWTMATGEDLRSPEVEGARPGLLTRLTHRYTDGVKLLITHDLYAFRAYIDVAHLLQPPSVLFQPRIMAGVLRELLRQRKPNAAA
jgi:2-polyprenyl-6-methoxyphenol hydroxylase-like FAD-dependent oxidoreductase